ncbi:hypothetical protein MAJ_06335, partial [Metarhizium majus ARSEF 297]
MPSLRSSTGEMLWCIQRLRFIASGIIKNRELANHVKHISLGITQTIENTSVFIDKEDIQGLAPVLPDLQKLANETPGRTKLLPVEDGDNIMDAFLEAFCALCLKIERIYLKMATVLRGFPRLLRLASDLNLSSRLILSLPEPEGQVTEFATSEFCRENGSSHFTLELEKSALFLYRDIIQGATVYDIVSLNIRAGEQTFPDDVEDVFSTFNTHKTIKQLTLNWTHQHSGNPLLYPRTSYFSLEGLQNLQHLNIKSHVLKTALMGAPSGSFARMLPKSLETLYIFGECEDWQLTALRDLVQGNHLPNLSCVSVDKIVGSSDLLDECCNEMASAEIGFWFKLERPEQSESPIEGGG